MIKFPENFKKMGLIWATTTVMIGVAENSLTLSLVRRGQKYQMR